MDRSDDSRALLKDDFSSLSTDLRAVFKSSDGRMSDVEFNVMALRCFTFQFSANPVYAAFCRGRGVTPESVASWEQIPAVPTSAFKAMPIFCGEPDAAEAVFRTSGTSRGPGARGAHYVADLTLYEASAVSTFVRHVLPDGIRPALVALVPDPDAVPDSSLSRMAGLVGHRLCRSVSFLATAEAGVALAGVDAALSAAVAECKPVLLLGTSFAFVHWTDAMRQAGTRYQLPDGSRIMETGGFKGRSREVERGMLYDTLEIATGISAECIVNEYGMTEMLSQFYEPVFVAPQSTLADRYHVGPGWVRTRVVNPVDLGDVPRGEPGILAHFDLANLGSVCSILTEDLGIQMEGGFRLLGRSSDAEPRGCSLSMEEFLQARSRA